jgi:prepilin-type processing-associated H-X9-DG protein
MRRWEGANAAVWVGVRNYQQHGEFGLRQTIALVNYKLNADGDPGAHRGFNSEHPGGAHFLFADGHVAFVSEDIHYHQAGAAGNNPALLPDIGLYQRLGRRNDGQPAREN